MDGGDLQAVAGTYKTTAHNKNDALALAVYIQDEDRLTWAQSISFKNGERKKRVVL